MKKVDKIKKHVKSYFCILICLFIFLSNLKSIAMEDINSELFILLDTSGSIKNSWNSVVQLVNEIGIYAQDTGIRIHLIRFGEEVKEIYNDKVNSNNIKEYIKKIEKLESNEAFTESVKAIKKVLDNQKSDIEKKCIVMLSDGILDYKDDSKEEDGKNEFIKEVNDFSAKINQSVILVKFNSLSNKKVEGIDIFSDLNEKVRLFIDDKNFNQSLIKEIFEKLGVEINEVQIDKKENNQIGFKSKENTNRIVIIVEILDKIINEVFIDSITIEKGRNKIEPQIFQRYDHYLVLIFEEEYAGDYTITLPDSSKATVKEMSNELLRIHDETQEQMNENNDNDKKENRNAEQSVEERTIKCYEQIDIEKEFEIEKEDKEEYYIYINDIKAYHLKGGNEENKLHKYKDGKLTFLKEGEYYVTVKSEKKCVDKEYNYMVIRKKNWWERLLELFGSENE